MAKQTAFQDLTDKQIQILAKKAGSTAPCVRYANLTRYERMWLIKEIKTQKPGKA